MPATACAARGTQRKQRYLPGGRGSREHGSRTRTGGEPVLQGVEFNARILEAIVQHVMPVVDGEVVPSIA